MPSNAAKTLPGPVESAQRRAGEGRAFAQRSQLGPGDLRMRAAAKPAVGAGNHAVGPHQAREALDALGDELGMLDEIGRVRHHARQDDLAGRQGQFERAVRLLGAAEALCRTLGLTPPAGLALEYERTVEDARTALGAEVFTAAWEDGRALNVEQALSYAL